jgi:xanthine dehydrogenase accessory factor
VYLDYILIKGAGDLASGVACILHQAGFPVVMTELDQPTCVRRRVSFAEAVYQGEAWVAGVQGILASQFSEAMEVTQKGAVAIIVDPEGKIAHEHAPKIYIDASMTKKNMGCRMDMGQIVLALGPGFEAGKDAHGVIETQRGPHLGEVILSGRAVPDSGVPGDVLGYTTERLLRSPREGIFQEVKSLGDEVDAGNIVAYVGEQPVRAQISGTIRGLLRSGLKVKMGMKVGDIHPEKGIQVVDQVTDKAWIIGLGILRAILILRKKSYLEQRKEKQQIFYRLEQCMKQGTGGVLYTLLESDGLEELETGARLLVLPDGEVVGSLGLPALDRDMVLLSQNKGMMTSGTEMLRWPLPWSKMAEFPEHAVQILREGVVSQKKIIIFGGGHISLPLAEIAVILGFRVIVVDDRDEFSNPQRFPGAEKTICCDFSELFEKNLLAGEIDPATSIVIVTRGHLQDRACVEYVIGSNAAYIGMIGSKVKVQSTFRKMLEGGYTRDELSKISSPIGLDLGGQSPAEIALSILAEIVATQYGASGKPVKELKGVILP